METTIGIIFYFIVIWASFSVLNKFLRKLRNKALKSHELREEQNKKTEEVLDELLKKLLEVQKLRILKIPEESFYILDLPLTATEDEIIKKFRKLSIIYHPDTSKNNANNFIKLVEAKDKCLNFIKQKNDKLHKNT